MSVDTLVEELLERLGGTSRDQLRAIASTPEARAVRERLDAAAHARRADLAKQLAALPRKHEKECTSRATRRIAAEARFAKAEIELRAARAELEEATVASTGLQIAIEAEAAGIENELRATCDLRLAKLNKLLEPLVDRARHTLIPAADGTPSGAAAGVGVMAVLNAMGEIRTYQLVPATRDEVTAKLQSWCATVAAALAPLGLRGPSVDGFGTVSKE